MSELFNDLVTGLNEAIEFEKGKGKARTHTFIIEPVKHYNKSEIKAIRTHAGMTQAVFEGVAYAMRDSLEVAKSLGIAIKETTICGGGAKSPLWKKIMANVLGIRVNTLEIEEGPAYGGAILAAIADGVYSSVEEAAGAIVRKVDYVEPEPELTTAYEINYRKFVEIYPALKEVFRIL